MEKKIKNSVVRLEMGDVTDVEVDAFVYYARDDLEIGSGYGTAIFMRGGPSVKKEIEGIPKPLGPGKAIVTGAGDMKARHIIHANGPKFMEPGLEEKLRETMRNVLKAADEKGFKRVAFPPMGSGFYGVPPDICAEVMVSELKKHLENNTGLEEVLLMPMHVRDFNPLKSRLESLN